jgi:hypothetical protein
VTLIQSRVPRRDLLDEDSHGEQAYGVKDFHVFNVHGVIVDLSGVHLVRNQQLEFFRRERQQAVNRMNKIDCGQAQEVPS